MTEHMGERESWKYCHRCNLAKTIGCPGRSLNCNTIPVTDKMISNLISKGMSPKLADHAREGAIAIQYGELGKETIVYLMSKKEPTQEDLERTSQLSLGNLVNADEFRITEEKIRKKYLSELLEEAKKSERFAS